MTRDSDFQRRGTQPVSTEDDFQRRGAQPVSTEEENNHVKAVGVEGCRVRGSCGSAVDAGLKP